MEPDPIFVRSAPSNNAELRITRLHSTLGGRVHDLDLRLSISGVQRDAIDSAMDRFAVLVIPNQRLEDEQLFAFANRFGPIEDAASGTHQDRRRLANAQINDISNLTPDGKIMAADDRHRMSSLGNLLWHSDSSYKTVPAEYSMLHARLIPPEGGETEFADMRAAWDELPERMKQKVRNLVCEHSMIYSRGKLGFDAFSPDEIERCTPVPQRLVRRYQGSGRLSLFLSAHIGRMQGWQTPEALALIHELTEFATQPKFVYRHVWQVNDLVIWDNRTTMHRGRSYESHIHPRDLRRVTVQGSSSTLDDDV